MFVGLDVITSEQGYGFAYRPTIIAKPLSSSIPWAMPSSVGMSALARLVEVLFWGYSWIHVSFGYLGLSSVPVMYSMNRAVHSGLDSWRGYTSGKSLDCMS